MTTKSTRRVQLKRVAAVQRGDLIEPGTGLFDRTGKRIVPAEETASWGKGTWYATGNSWMNDVPEICVPLAATAAYIPTDILHAPMDAYVVVHRIVM